MGYFYHQRALCEQKIRISLWHFASSLGNSFHFLGLCFQACKIEIIIFVIKLVYVCSVIQMLAQGRLLSFANWRQRFQILLPSPGCLCPLFIPQDWVSLEYTQNSNFLSACLSSILPRSLPSPTPDESYPKRRDTWPGQGWGSWDGEGCGECGWIQSPPPGCAAPEGAVRWMVGVQGWGEGKVAPPASAGPVVCISRKPLSHHTSSY